MNTLKRFLLIVSSLAIAAVPLLASRPASANSYFGGNGRLVFYSPVTLDSTEQEIYTVRPDGTDLKRITNNNVADANPQWAPSGDKIAFDRYVDGTQMQDLFIQNINADGSANGSPTVISGANTPAREFDPSWSPNGNQIAYHRCELDVNDECDTPYQIYVIAATGGTPTRLTTDTDFSDREPTWNKDGDFLTFTHLNVNTDVSYVGVRASSGSSAVTPVSIGASPQWSPTANKVIFARDGELWTYDKDADDADGTGPSDNLNQLTNGATITSAPTWSPDGRLIAASSGGVLRYYNATTGAVVRSVTLASNSGLGFTASNNANELDWARAEAPDNTNHECTTYVNEDCTEFSPEIPEECQAVLTAAANGTPKYQNQAHVYTPNQGFVGNDSYVYQYYDQNMNAITCTVAITVLPRAPDSGAKNGLNLAYIAVASIIIGGVVVRRRLADR